MAVPRAMHVLEGAKVIFDRLPQLARRVSTQHCDAPSSLVALRQYRQRMESILDSSSLMTLVFTWKDGRPAPQFGYPLHQEQKTGRALHHRPRSRDIRKSKADDRQRLLDKHAPPRMPRGLRRWSLGTFKRALYPPRSLTTIPLVEDGDKGIGRIGPIRGGIVGVVFGVGFGARRSEVLGLRWRDLDLVLSTMAVPRAMHVLEGAKVIFEEPKSQKGKRSIAMPPSSLVALRQYRQRMESILGPRSDDDLVFTWKDGRPMRPNSVTHAFKRIARRVGAGYYSAKAVDELYALGVDPFVAPEQTPPRPGCATRAPRSHTQPSVSQGPDATEVYRPGGVGSATLCGCKLWSRYSARSSRAGDSGSSCCGDWRR